MGTEPEAPEPVPAALPEAVDASVPAAAGLEMIRNLMKSHEESEGLKKRFAEQKFYVVVLQDRVEPRVLTAEDVPTVIKVLAEVRKQKRVNAFIFRGEPWGVTKGEFKYLVSPAGERFPLFDESAQIDIDPFGRLDDDLGEADAGDKLLQP